MKLEIKHLLPYLPYDLKVFVGSTQRELTAISLDSNFVFVTLYKGSREKVMIGINQLKPLLKPLSKFTIEDYNEIKLSFNNWNTIYEDFFDQWFEEKVNLHSLILMCPNNVIQYFFENHYDVFSLIDAGLAEIKE
jgi:hypothetical protein